ncbi:MAG TPA: GAF domain-containing sensor histidine kinase [Anaeromyxobacteraceae bacterium]
MWSPRLRPEGAGEGGAGRQLEPGQLLFLHQAAGRLFASPGDYGATLEALGRLAVPEVADWCAVDLLCEDGTLARAALRHRDPERTAIADELRQLPPALGPLDPERVAASGDTDLVDSVAAEPELAAACQRPGRAAEILRRLGLESFVTVPLAARGRRLGALTLACGDSGRRYDAAALAFAQELGSLCALALDNVRLFRDGEEARSLAERSARIQEDAARFGEQLLGIVSHDLRTPLAAIVASNQLALRRAGGDEALLRPLRRAAGAAKRMEGMVADLLDFTRARLGGGIPLRRREADLGKIARYAVEEAQAAHPEHPLVHRLHYEKALCDPDRMSQVVQNLIANALEHGAPRAPVVVETRREADRLVLSVVNQGPQIPGDLLPGLFEPFRRGHSARARSLGLGLFIVREIVRAHGGSVEAQSDAGGTRFVVRLPQRG